MSRTTRKVLSQSQILRNTFFQLWKLDNEGMRDFSEYYESKMEAINSFYKKLLDNKKHNN